MSRIIELRRHTANDGDALSADGVREALRIGRTLGPFDVVVSTGAQRATQTAACFLAVMMREVRDGVIVDDGFRSQHEDRWREIYATTKRGELEGFLELDRDFVESESLRFTEALRRVSRHMSEGGRALVVGHSPMLEATVWGATGQTIAPLRKGEGVELELDAGGFRIRV